MKISTIINLISIGISCSAIGISCSELTKERLNRRKRKNESKSDIILGPIYNSLSQETNTKYKLLKEDSIEYEGRTLYRIQALKDFANIKKGDLGGYIESEYNLSYRGDCWVYDNQKVFGDEIIHDVAKIYGFAKVDDTQDCIDFI